MTGDAGSDADQPAGADQPTGDHEPADADEAAMPGASRAPTQAPGPAPTTRRPRLSLDDPLTGRAAEDRPEGWGERADSDSDRLAHYRAQRPPHHGQ